MLITVFIRRKKIVSRRGRREKEFEGYMLNRVEHVDRAEEVGLDGINKIDRIGEDMGNPHIGTNLQKPICGDMCGFEDCNFGEQVEKYLHVSARSARLK